MIILILLSLMVAGGIFAIWYGKKKAYWVDEDSWIMVGSLVLILGAFGLLASGIPAICIEIEEPMMYENKIEQYEMLLSS